MASYMHTKDIKPEDLEPYKEPELSKKEKRKNWLYYMRKPLIGIGLLLLLVALLIKDIAFKVQPDLSIGIVSPYGMPSEFVNTLTEELEASIGDLNGDGKVVVSIETFSVSPATIAADGSVVDNNTDPQVYIADTTRLAAVHQLGSPSIFILEPGKADYYQENYLLVGGLDGQFYPENTAVDDIAFRWGDSEFLTSLNLDFTTIEGIEIDGMQEVLADYYVGMLPLWEKQYEKKKVFEPWENSRNILLEWFN